MEAEQDLSVRVAGYEARIEQLEGALAELGHELVTMQEALESRALIGRATGLLAGGLHRPATPTDGVDLHRAPIPSTGQSACHTSDFA